MTKKITSRFLRLDFGMCDTAYFYFKKWNKLLCVEYWMDEDIIAPCGQYFTLDGEIIENNIKSLSEHEQTEYLKFCKEEIKK